MYELTKGYLDIFPVSKELLAAKGMNNFGLVAVLEEKRIRSLPDTDRASVKAQHKNFGIGKTHLQIALSKVLIKQGFNVLVLSDVSFMDDIMNAKRMKDDGETFKGMLNSALPMSWYGMTSVR